MTAQQAQAQAAQQAQAQASAERTLKELSFGIKHMLFIRWLIKHGKLTDQ